MTKRNVISIAVAAVVILVTIVSCMFLNSNASEYDLKLSTQLEEIDTLRTKITVAKANAEGTKDVVVHQATGIDVKRKEADDELAKAFAEKILTWNGYSEYQQMRKTVMEEYNIAASSNLMLYFLPSRPSGYTSEEAELLSSQFNGFESVCYSIDTQTGVYQYFAEIKCVTGGQLGGSATVRSILTYSVDENGIISNIMAYSI